MQGNCPTLPEPHNVNLSPRKKIGSGEGRWGGGGECGRKEEKSKPKTIHLRKWWSWGSVSLVALQPTVNWGSEGLGWEGLGSDGFLRKIIPQADGRGEEGHVEGASNWRSLDVLEGVFRSLASGLPLWHLSQPGHTWSYTSRCSCVFAKHFLCSSSSSSIPWLRGSLGHHRWFIML